MERWDRLVPGIDEIAGLDGCHPVFAGDVTKDSADDVQKRHPLVTCGDLQRPKVVPRPPAGQRVGHLPQLLVMVRQLPSLLLVRRSVAPRTRYAGDGHRVGEFLRRQQALTHETLAVAGLAWSSSAVRPTRLSKTKHSPS